MMKGDFVNNDKYKFLQSGQKSMKLLFFIKYRRFLTSFLLHFSYRVKSHTLYLLNECALNIMDLEVINKIVLIDSFELLPDYIMFVFKLFGGDFQLELQCTCLLTSKIFPRKCNT